MSITITRPLTESGCNLISAFNISTIDFYTTSELQNAKIYIGAYEFIPYLESTSSPIYYYSFDFTDILKYVIGKYEFGYTESLTYTIKTFNSGGSVTSTASETIEVCFGYNQFGADNSALIDLFNKGRSHTLYSASNYISFYWKGANGTYNFKVNGGTSTPLTLVHGFNYSGFSLIEGLNIITCDTEAQFLVNVYFKNITTGEPISWGGRDGTLIEWYFRSVSGTIKTTKSNPVSVYKKESSLLRARSIDMTAESIEEIILDCVAVNDEHHRQLTEIQESFIIDGIDYRYKLVDCTKLSNSCRQNRYFTMTLKRDRYVATY